MPSEPPVSGDEQQEPRTVAAVDLGSNSFHMVVAQVVDGQLNIIDRLREMVRLAAGLNARNELSPEVAQRAFDCLRRFGQRVRDLPRGAVRAVGTNTLRKARHSDDFLTQAESALGHPIDIIAGREEARLIYLGVSHTSAVPEGRCLVADIGGGSTEVIIGEHFDPQYMESLYMGCVSMSQSHFGDGVIDKKRMRKAEIAARLEVQPVERSFRQLGWKGAIGASGTIKAIGNVVNAAGWCNGGITLESLCKLRDALVEAGHVDRLQLAGLSPERAPVFPGGVAILLGLFEELGINAMQVSDGALREGLLYDMLGRLQHEDVRERTINVMRERYSVDRLQAARVELTAMELLRQAGEPWCLDQDEHANLLRWAADLHEIGLAVTHSGYQKHGAYLIENSDMPGFSRREQSMLAMIVRAHRRKFPSNSAKGLHSSDEEAVRCLAVLLRMAVLLHRSRLDDPLPPFLLNTGKKSLHLEFPDNWLRHHPLTKADLAKEADLLAAAKLQLSFA